MTRPKFHDAATIGRTPPKRDPKPDTAETLRKVQWRQLEAGLFSLTNAQFEYERGDVEAGRMHTEDCRRALGALALTLADGPDAEGYARLFSAITADPKTLQ